MGSAPLPPECIPPFTSKPCSRKFAGSERPLRGAPATAGLILVLLGLLVFSLMAAVTFGSTDIPMADVYHVIAHQLFGVGDPAWGDGNLFRAVWYIRLPRLILAMAIGMGLSVCGVVMQAVVKNPMADPYVLGISSGASLGATAAILLGVGSALGSNFVGVMAFLGAFAISLAVVGLANIGGRANSVKLLLAGTALSSVCSAFSSFIVYFAHDREGMQTVTYWLMGALGGATWGQDAVVALVIGLGVCYFLTQFRTLNLMLLGDETSITLGTDLHRKRQQYLLVSAAMVGFSVYAAGMIGFVGLVIPHVVRMAVGTDHRRLLPVSALVGAIFLIWADVACRTVIPGQELPIGILTSVIGAPCFIYLMARKRYGFGGGE